MAANGIPHKVVVGLGWIGCNWLTDGTDRAANAVADSGSDSTTDTAAHAAVSAHHAIPYASADKRADFIRSCPTFIGAD
jgi:hypothetical protein